MVSAQPLESVPDHDEPPEGVPAWSGKFIEYIPRTLGVLELHADDTRTIPFPKGWYAAGAEPVYVNDFEVWVLICEQADLPEGSPILHLLEQEETLIEWLTSTHPPLDSPST